MRLSRRHAFALALCAAVVLSDTVRNTRKRASLREQVFAASVWYTTAAAMRRGGPSPVDVSGGGGSYTNPETVYAEPTIPTVALNGTYTTLDNVVTRLTDNASTEGGSGTGICHWYVDRSPMNASSTWVVLIGTSGGWKLLPVTVTGSAGSETIASGAAIALPVGGGGQPANASAGVWDATDGNTYWMTESSGYKFWKLNVSTLTWTLVRDFTADLPSMSAFTGLPCPWDGTAGLFLASVKADGSQAVFDLRKESKNSFGTLIYNITGNSIVRFDVGTDMGAGRTPAPPSSAASFTGAMVGNELTVTGHSGGVIGYGQIVSGSGVASGTYIAAFGTGTGGNGTYVTIPANTLSARAMVSASAQGAGAISGTVFTDTTHDFGTFGVGDILTGTGVSAGTQIVSLGTGTGQNNGGTYNVSISQTVGSTTISGQVINRYNGAGTDKSYEYLYQQEGGCPCFSGWGAKQYVIPLSGANPLIGASAPTSYSLTWRVNAAHGVAFSRSQGVLQGLGYYDTASLNGGAGFHDGIVKYDLTSTPGADGYAQTLPFAYWLITGRAGAHISANVPHGVANNDKWAFLSLYQDVAGSGRIQDKPMANELIAFDTTANMTQPGGAGTQMVGHNIVRLGHHFAAAWSVDGLSYWRQPHASTSLDGKWLFFGSSLGDAAGRYDLFAMRLPTSVRP